jgi:hypothetical protein
MSKNIEGTVLILHTQAYKKVAHANSSNPNYSRGGD